MEGRSSYITTEIAAINTEGSGYITSDVGINPPYICKRKRQAEYHLGCLRIGLYRYTDYVK